MSYNILTDSDTPVRADGMDCPSRKTWWIFGGVVGIIVGVALGGHLGLGVGMKVGRKSGHAAGVRSVGEASKKKAAAEAASATSKKWDARFVRWGGGKFIEVKKKGESWPKGLPGGTKKAEVKKEKALVRDDDFHQTVWNHQKTHKEGWQV